jgi:hypothetical protein
MMIDSFEQELARHAQLCEELLCIAREENEALRSPSFQIGCYDERKRNVSKRMADTLSSLRRFRQAWQVLAAEERARHPQVLGAVRVSQELAMKLIVLDRENEQALLRRGLVSPQHLPNAARQQPHFASTLYRRSAIG